MAVFTVTQHETLLEVRRCNLAGWACTSWEIRQKFDISESGAGARLRVLLEKDLITWRDAGRKRFPGSNAQGYRITQKGIEVLAGRELS